MLKLLFITSIFICLLLPSAQGAKPKVSSLSRLILDSARGLEFLNDSYWLSHINSRPFQAYVTGVLLKTECCERNFISKQKLCNFMAKLERNEKEAASSNLSILYQAVYNFCQNYLLICTEDDLEGLDEFDNNFLKIVRKEFNGEGQDVVPFGYIAAATLSFFSYHPRKNDEVEQAYQILNKIPEICHIIKKRYDMLKYNPGIPPFKLASVGKIYLPLPYEVEAGYMKLKLTSKNSLLTKERDIPRLVYKVNTVTGEEHVEGVDLELSFEVKASSTLYVISDDGLTDAQLWMLRKWSRGELSDSEGFAVQAFLLIEEIGLVPGWSVYDFMSSLDPESPVSQAFFMGKVLLDSTNSFLYDRKKIHAMVEKGSIALKNMPHFGADDKHLLGLNTLKKLCASMNLFLAEHLQLSLIRESDMFFAADDLSKSILERFAMQGGDIYSFITYLAFYFLRWRNGWYISEESQKKFTVLYSFPELRKALEDLFKSIEMNLAELRMRGKYPDIRNGNYLAEFVTKILDANDNIIYDSYYNGLMYMEVHSSINGLFVVYRGKDGSSMTPAAGSILVIFDKEVKGGFGQETVGKFLHRCALGDATANEIALANAFVLVNNISIIRPTN